MTENGSDPTSGLPPGAENPGATASDAPRPAPGDAPLPVAAAASPGGTRGGSPPPPSRDDAPSAWDRVRSARVPQLLGVYAGASFGILQVADIFVSRLGLPDWTFFGLLLVLLAGLPVVMATALVQAEGASLRARALLNWRNTSVAGFLAVGGLAVLVGGFMGARALGIGPVGSLVAAGVIERDGSILIGDFQSPTGDELLAGAITEAFRIDFEQSSVVRVISPGMVRDALLRMERAPDTPLTPALARELALREGIQALVLGEINRVGGGSIISVRLVAPDSEEAIASFRETISDDSEIIGAVDRLSNRLRERIGESLRSIRAGEPLAQVTTSSLPALRRYSQAVRALDLERDIDGGIAYLEQAIAEDSTFAMAWRKLGIVKANENRPRAEVEEALTRAYALSDRLTERERLITRASYYNAVTGEQDRAMVTYRALLDLYPAETTALNNLAVIHVDRGEREEAVELLRRAIAADSSTVLYYTNLVHQEMALEDWESARRTMDAMERRFPALGTAVDQFEARIRWIEGDLGGAEERFLALDANPRAGLGDRVEALFGLSSLAILQGRAEEGLAWMRELTDLQARAGAVMGEAQMAYTRAYRDLALAQDTARALETVNAFLASEPVPPEAAWEGAHLSVASFYLQAGEVERGREWYEEHLRIVGEPDPNPNLALIRRATEALLRLRSGEEVQALEWARQRVREQPEDPEARHALATFHDRLGAPDSAVVHFEAYLSTPATLRIQTEHWVRPGVLERLGELHEGLGNRDRARSFYLRLAELWAEADPPLQPRVRRARERAEALAGGG